MRQTWQGCRQEPGSICSTTLGILGPYLDGDTAGRELHVQHTSQVSLVGPISDMHPVIHSCTALDQPQSAQHVTELAQATA